MDMSQAQAIPGAGVAPAARDEAEAVAKAAPRADPAPLGLAGFALTTLLLSVVNAGFVKDSSLALVIGCALAYGGLGQIIAGIWEFRNGNTFGATAFSSYGGFWLSFAVFVIVFSGKDAGPEVGWYLLAWGGFTFYMWIATLKHAWPVMVTFLLLWVTFVLLAVGAFGGDGPGAGLTQIGGYVGILTAIAAWYASAQNVINEAWGNILPH
jgi:succinate-acetate transporter protein